ncbi:hypothetical protein QBC32DRAFT_258514, partial [Pseudoneurospora amorphoporcata]
MGKYETGPSSWATPTFSFHHLIAHSFKAAFGGRSCFCTIHFYNVKHRHGINPARVVRVCRSSFFGCRWELLLMLALSTLSCHFTLIAPFLFVCPFPSPYERLAIQTIQFIRKTCKFTLEVKQKSQAETLQASGHCHQPMYVPHLHQVTCAGSEYGSNHIPSHVLRASLILAHAASPVV